DDEREVVRIARVRAEPADEDLRLRALRFVDENEPSPGRYRGLPGAVHGRGPRAHGGRQRLGNLGGALFGDVPGESEEEIFSNDCLAIELSKHLDVGASHSAERAAR